jgi:glycerate dehydrogenase
MTRIVVLDGYAANPGDLSWTPLEQLGNLVVHPRTPKEKVISRCKGASAIITNKVCFDADTLDALPDLKYIGVSATGVNVIDLEACDARGITVTNVPAYSTDSVAQMTFALLLELVSSVGAHSQAVREQDRWTQSQDFCFWDRPLTELAGLTLGLIGYGAIGKAVARIAQAFGMSVIVHRRNTTEPAEAGIRYVLLKKLLQKADIVSLHCPLTPETDCVIDSNALEQMKPNALLINTGRGPLIDEQAVANALIAGTLAGCGVDVLSTEPPAPDNPLLAAPHCVITPHIAWATRAARQRLLDTLVTNLDSFQKEKPQNCMVSA